RTCRIHLHKRHHPSPFFTIRQLQPTQPHPRHISPHMPDTQHSPCLSPLHPLIRQPLITLPLFTHLPESRPVIRPLTSRHRHQRYHHPYQTPPLSFPPQIPQIKHTTQPRSHAGCQRQRHHPTNHHTPPFPHKLPHAQQHQRHRHRLREIPTRRQ